MRLHRFRPSPAMVVALIALFVSLGGVGIAATKIGTKQIKNGAVTAKKLHKNAVTKKKIKNNAVIGSKIADGAVQEDELGPAAVTSDKIADDAVTTGKLADGAVTTDKLGDQAVTSGKLSPNAVTATKLSTVVRESSMNVPNGTTALVSVACDPGEKVLGGGGGWSGGFNNAQAAATHIVHTFKLSGAEAWRVRGYNNSGTDRTL